MQNTKVFCSMHCSTSRMAPCCESMYVIVTVMLRTNHNIKLPGKFYFLDLDLYIAGTIFTMELGECNANIKCLHKKNSLCGSILQSLFQIFKNWLKCISALTAYVWRA